MTSRDEALFSGLLDAEHEHRVNPMSFSIPRSDVRKSLERGATVKLLFSVGPGVRPSVERMWVEVEEVGGDRYVGRLLNVPEVISDLAVDARITFGPEHIAAIDRRTPHEPLPEQFAVVSERMWRESARPERAARRVSPDAAFSGWFVFGAGDPEVPPADFAGFVPVPHAALTTRYRAFDSIEDEPPGTAWRWDAEAVEWTRDGTPA
jgi:hypothetical protein